MLDYIRLVDYLRLSKISYLKLSLTTIWDYLRQQYETIFENYLRLSLTITLDYHIKNFLRQSLTTVTDYLRQLL